MGLLADLIGDSPGISALRETVRRLLARPPESGRLPPVLIQGETGTGKGLLARGLHGASSRAGGPFVDVNCAAIPETLLEAELFGYERGAFTDARHPKAGLFQVATHGALFLDEVGLLPEPLQAKLLKAIEDRAVRRVGGTRTESVDVWILAASNEDLLGAVRARRFREDLYHRLAVVTLRLPPLRERGDDVLVLAEHFLRRACADYGLRLKALGADAREALLAYPWPGNIRELANTMERVALLGEAAVVSAEMLGLPGALPSPAALASPPPEAGPRLSEALGSVERTHLVDALRQSGGNVTRAAAALGISRDTLRYRMVKHGLARWEGAQSTPRPGPGRRRAVASAPVAPLTPVAPAAREATPGAGEATEAVGPVAARWERRRLAFLRCAVLVPPDGDPRLYPSRALEVLEDKVRSFGGRIDELGPAGLVAVFGLEPVEDAPLRAAFAAAAIQAAAARAASGERLPFRAAIEVRPVLVSLSRGSPQVDLDGKREAWALLDGLVAAAEPGEILVGAAAAASIGRHVDLVAGPWLPGADRTHRLVVGEPADPGVRRAPPFVGRQRELDLLRSRFEDAVRGHGQVVGILGAPGLGKSRLLHEFQRAVRSDPDVRVTYLESRCRSFATATPYFPILELLRQNFRIVEGDGPDVVTEKVQGGLAAVGVDPDRSAPYLLHLFGVPGATARLAALTTTAVKVGTFQALRRLVLSGTHRRPLILVVDDIQWIDSISEECFTALMDSAAGARAMAVVTYRPGYRAPWMDRSYVTQIALQPLAGADSLSVIRWVRQPEEVPEALAAAIVDRAEGNPFFLEELARMVEGGSPPGAVPDTIQEVLLARIDRLPETTRRLLQVAAVIGREAPLPLLRALWEGDPEPHLRELVRLEFLYAEAGGIEPSYAFTQALSREVVEETLSVADRQALHAAAAAALMRLHAERLDEVHDQLAYHYARTDRPDQAIHYLRRLAERAARDHAHAEAVRLLAEALGQAGRLPEAERDRCRLALAISQVHSLFPLGRFEESLALLLPYRPVLEALDDPLLAGTYHFLTGRSCLFLGREREAADHADRGLAEATRAGDIATQGQVHYVLAQAGALGGWPRKGLEHGERAVALLGQAGEPWWVGPAHWSVGLNHALLGDFEAALAAQARAAASGEAVGDPQVQSSAAWGAGVVHTARGDWDWGVRSCEHALEISPDPLNTALALGWLGYGHVERGDAASAIPRLEQAVGLLGQFHFPQPQSLFMALLADAHRLTGSLGPALGVARRALTLAGSRYGRAWAEGALGRIARDQGAAAPAAEHLREALSAFGEAGARYFVGRAHLDLAGLGGGPADGPGAARDLGEAHRIFRALRVPFWVEQTERRARQLGAEL